MLPLPLPRQGLTSSTNAKEEAQIKPAKAKRPKETVELIMGNLNLPYPKMLDMAVPGNLICSIQAKGRRWSGVWTVWFLS